MTTTQTTTAPVPTYDDLSAAVARLATQVADLTGQLREAQETACELQRERDQVQIRADTNARLAGAFRNDLDEVRLDLRRALSACRELTVVKGALEQQIDRMQNEPEQRPDDHTRRWPFKRVGNAL
jgi:chromosome segregation ATPase